MNLEKFQEQVSKYEKEVNDMAFRIWEIGDWLSEDFGTRVTVEFKCDYEEWGPLKVIVRVPRPCGFCSVELSEPLTLDTPNLKNIVLKMREIESILDENYEYNDIYIPCEINYFEQASISEIVELV